MNDGLNFQYIFVANKSAKETLAQSEYLKETARYTRPRAVDLSNLMNRLVERIAQAGSD